MKKRGQSNVITIVLIILLSLVAVIILWNIVYGTVIKSSRQVNVNIFDNTFDIKETKIYLNGTIRVSVKRISGNDSIDSLKFLFYNREGEVTSVERKNIPGQLETYNYDFSSNEINMQVDSISVVPIIGKNAGLEAKEPVDLIKRDSDGNRILEPINGLISWWKLNGDMKDSFGNNNGNCSGNYCPSYGEDRNGNPNGAGVFDGINDDIFIARSSSTDTLTKNGTISVWIKARSLSGIAPVNSIYSGICSVVDWASTGAGGFILYVYNDTMPLRRKVVAHFGSGNTPNSKYALSKTVLDYDSWYNLVMVFDHDKGYIYVNGSLEDYANIPGGDTLALTLVKHIGSHSGTIRFFNGSIDDVIVFNRPLTAEEIKGIYNMQK